MQRIQTRLTALLGNIVSPIVVPPMAGAAGGALAGQVSLAGGYGFVGSGPVDVASFTAELEAVRKPLRLPPDAPLPIGTGHLAFVLDKGGSTVDALRVALDKRVQSVWLSFGSNLGKWVDFVRRYDQERPETTRHKTLIWILINSLEEAQKAVNDLKADVLVVQGNEAGGHGHGQALPLISLLPLVKAAIPNGPPLVAAGGIANGAQAAGLLVMGADGVVMGTTFLATPESTYSKNQKQAIIEGTTTVRTLIYDTARGRVGWPDGVDGRAIPNKTFYEANEGVDIEELKKRYNEAEKNDDTTRRVVFSGSSVGLVKEIKGAKILLEEIHGEMAASLTKASQYL